MRLAPLSIAALVAMLFAPHASGQSAGSETTPEPARDVDDSADGAVASTPAAHDVAYTDAALTDEELSALAEGETIEIVGTSPLLARPPAEHRIERRELELAAGSRNDAIDGLRSLPGIARAPSYGSLHDLVIRGTSGEDSIYLLDGVQLPLSMHFGNAQAVVPSAMLECIELVPGGFGVEYGRATGGVVAMQTRASETDRYEGFAEISFINAAAFATGPLWRSQSLSFAVAVRRSLIDAIAPALIPDDVDLSFTTPPQYHDGQLRVDWRPSSSHHVAAVGALSLDRLALVLDEDNPADPVVTGAFSGEDGFWRGILRWSYDADRVANTATLAIGDSLLEHAFAPPLHYRLAARALTARDDMHWRAANWLGLRVGTELVATTTEIDAVMPLPPSEGTPAEVNFTTAPRLEVNERARDLDLAGYVAADLRPIAALVLTPGLRVDHLGHLGATVLQPRVSASFRTNRGITFRGAAGTYARPLSLAEGLREDLAPERALHAVLGAEARLAEGVSASVSLYRSALSDLIVQVPVEAGTDALQSYVNRGTGRAEGAELLIRARGERYFGWLAYTLARARRTDGPGMSERAFDQDQPHNLVAVASYRIGAWSVGGKFQFVSGAPYTPIVGAVYLADHDVYRPSYAPRNSMRHEAAHQLDIRVDRRFEFEHLTLSVYFDLTNAYAHARTIDYAYSYDYREREPVTDIPILPALGVRGAF